MSRLTADSHAGAAEIVDFWLPYATRLTQRTLDTINLVVIHCTELPDLAEARAFGEHIRYDSGTGNSGHFYIDRDGRIERWVPEDRIAHHVRGHNAHSLGIELVNRGRWPDWYDSRRQQPTEAYPDVQIQALIALLVRLRSQLTALSAIAGHDALDTDTVPASDDPDICVQRKIDPGPLFPWPAVIAATGLHPLPHPSDPEPSAP